MSSSFVAQHELYKVVMSNGDCDRFMQRMIFIKRLSIHWPALHRFKEWMQPRSCISIWPIWPKQTGGKAFPKWRVLQSSMPAEYQESCPFEGLHRKPNDTLQSNMLSLPFSSLSSALLIFPKDETCFFRHDVLVILHCSSCSSKFFWSVTQHYGDKTICKVQDVWSSVSLKQEHVMSFLHLIIHFLTLSNI